MSSLSEQRFLAAVNVIRGLPKNGSYQPSHDMQLRFYSFFKQATEGPCNQKRPGIWNPVSRAKWEAWNRLGNMPKETAMNSYVEELKKIIETMSYTDNVADFMGSINELDGVNVDDLEAVAPDAIKKVRSQPNSPFASREASPVRAPYQNGHNGAAALTNGHHGDALNAALVAINGNGYQNGHTTEQSDDEYTDTIDDDDADTIGSFHSASTVPHTSRTKVRYLPASSSSASGAPSSVHHRSYGGQSSSSAPTIVPSSLEVDLRFHNVLSQLNMTVERINMDVQQVMGRMLTVEKTLNDVAKSQNSLVRRRGHPKWWPFKELSPNWVIFIVLWPFVAHKLVSLMSRKK